MTNWGPPRRGWLLYTGQEEIHRNNSMNDKDSVWELDNVT